MGAGDISMIGTLSKAFTNLYFHNIAYSSLINFLLITDLATSTYFQFTHRLTIQPMCVPVKHSAGEEISGEVKWELI